MTFGTGTFGTITYTNNSSAYMPIMGTVTSSGAIAQGLSNTSSTGIWNAWNSTSTNSSTVVWQGWHQAQYAQQMALHQHVAQQMANYQQAAYQPPAERTAAWAQEQRRMQQAEVERVEARSNAAARARQLLEGHLSEKQLATYRKHQWFIVTGGKTKRRYVICCDRGWTGNVYELDKNSKALRRMCCHANDNSLPEADHYLVQKLWLEHNEAAFLKEANYSPSDGLAPPYDEAA